MIIDIDFDGTDIESLKIKEKNNKEDLNLSKGKSDSQEEQKNKDDENKSNNKDSEVFKNNITNKSEDKDKLKNDLIKILEVSIDKIEID